MNNSDIIDIIEKELTNINLCQQKKNNYSALLNKIKTSKDKIFLYDECSLRRDTIKSPNNEKNLPHIELNVDKLLEQTKNIQIDNIPLVNENDSILKIYVFYSFIVNQLLIEGKVDVYHNKEKRFEKSIIDRKFHLSGGHGGREVLFPDTSFAKHISFQSSAIGPDIECWDTITLKSFLNLK